MVVSYFTLDKNKSLYFIAIIPPAIIYNQILDWKNYFAEYHNSKASLKSPPHLTLHMPFRFSQAKEDKIYQCMQDVASDYQSFNLKLNNFLAFEPRVISINVEENQALRGLQKSLARAGRASLDVFNDSYKDRGFTPHITLAFRDLKKPEFYKAWKKFEKEKFEVTFTVQDICLLKHNGTEWQVYHKQPLRKTLEIG